LGGIFGGRVRGKNGFMPGFAFEFMLGALGRLVGGAGKGSSSLVRGGGVSALPYGRAAVAALDSVLPALGTCNFGAPELEGFLRLYGVRPGGSVLEVGSTQPFQDVKLAAALRGRLVVYDSLSESDKWVQTGKYWAGRGRADVAAALPGLVFAEERVLLGDGGVLPTRLGFPGGGVLEFRYGRFEPGQRAYGRETFDCVIAPFCKKDGRFDRLLMVELMRVLKPDGCIVLKDTGGKAGHLAEFRGILAEVETGKVLHNRSKLTTKSYIQYDNDRVELVCFGGWEPVRV
jgi:hypothetical protein